MWRQLLNDTDPHQYLSDVLMRLAARDSTADVSDLTPVEWYKENNGGQEPAVTSVYPSKNLSIASAPLSSMRHQMVYR